MFSKLKKIFLEKRNVPEVLNQKFENIGLIITLLLLITFVLALFGAAVISFLLAIIH